MEEQERQGYVSRFARLFSGFTAAYGTYIVKGANSPGDKVEGRAITRKEPIPEDAWKTHLSGGAYGLGIIPLAENNCCWWGAIDIDDRKIDHVALEKKVRESNIPLIVCRSKSGGAHLYIFFTDMVPAGKLRAKLQEWVAYLGYAPSTEIFPKQISRADPSDLGNWINLPYYRAAETDRYAFKEGQPVGLPEFLNMAEAARAEPSILGGKVVDEQLDPNDDLYEAPPCLQYILSHGGFGEGMRNDGMMALGTYLKKRFPDNWKEKIITANQKYCVPPMLLHEVNLLTKSLDRKEYNYRCKNPPISAHCNRKLCVKRKFGIGEDNSKSISVPIETVNKYVSGPDDPVMWGLEIGGQRILVDTETFYQKDSFNRAAMGKLSRIVVFGSQAAWLRTVDELMQKASVIEIPPDAGPVGHVWDYIVEFCRGKAPARTKEDVAQGRPYMDPDHGFVWFRATALKSYLDVRRASSLSLQRIWFIVDNKGGKREEWQLGKARVVVWGIPMPADPHPEPRPVPAMEQIDF